MENQQSSPTPRGLHALELREQGKTLSEIADYLHVTSERARQILLRAEIEVEAYRKFKELKERCAALLPRSEVPAEIHGMTIDYLNLSARSSNCLIHANIRTIGKLIGKTSIQLSIIKNMGKKSVDEISFTLEELGLTLADMPIRFSQRRLPPVSMGMRTALQSRGWTETAYREWTFNDDKLMNWEDAAIAELNRDRG